MHNNNRKERKLLRLSYLFILVCFFNLAIIQNKLDKGAIIIAFVLIVLLGFSHFIVKKFFPKGDKYLLIFANLLAVIGIVMIYRMYKDIAIKQIIWVILGISLFMFVVVLLPDLSRFAKYKYVYLVLTIILMSLGTFFAKETYGSKNWIQIGGTSFQPSEFAKLTLVAYLAAALHDYQDKIKSYVEAGKDRRRRGSNNTTLKKSIQILIEPAIVVMISLGFMVLQKDLGSALLFFAISITMLYIGTSKGKYVFWCIGLFMVGATISYFLFDHVQVRVQIWLDPWKYASGKGYQLVQSLIAIASGGFFGTGLGLGQPKIIPVVTSDFIFSAICEEMGIAMGIGTMLIYFLLFYRSMRAAIKTEDDFSKLLAVGYSTMMAAQVLVIIGGVIGAIPLTGITLPFISAGGSSMLITFFALGIIQKISEEGN